MAASKVDLQEMNKTMRNVRNLEPVLPRGMGWLNPEEKVPFCVWYKGIVLPIHNSIHLDDVEALQFDATDVFLCGQMKTGTTWLSEILYHLINGGKDLFNPNLMSITKRVPTVSESIFGTSIIAATPPPRLVKSHLSYYALPSSYREVKPKTIYLMRNPKDTCVSLYHFTKAMITVKYSGTFNDIVESYIEGTNYAYGPFAQSIRSFWENKKNLNIIFVSYEDFHKDFEKEVKRVAAFLGIVLDETLLTNIRKATSLEFMRENKSTNYKDIEELGGLKFPQDGGFMRKGTVGDWKNHFTEEQSKKMDEWIERELGPLGIKFCYELE